MTERDLTGLRGGDRGQTTQDFAVGISVFLLTVTFTFAFVPSTVTPFGSPVTDAIPAKSDRVASTIVDKYSVDDRSRTLDGTAFDNNVLEKTPDELREEVFGLRATAQINITVQNRSGEIIDADLGSGSPLVAGDDYPSNQAAASTTRIIRLPGVEGCKTGCLLVVRVW